jgi:hypothetical protein
MFHVDLRAREKCIGTNEFCKYLEERYFWFSAHVQGPSMTEDALQRSRGVIRSGGSSSNGGGNSSSSSSNSSSAMTKHGAVTKA